MGTPCNGRKGGSWAVARQSATGVGEFVTRSSERWGGGDMGTVVRTGNQVCAQSSSLPRLCLDVPAGALAYEVVLGPEGGARCVAGCGGTPPPPPPPRPALRDDAAFVSQSVPARVGRGATFTVTLTLRNTGTSTWTRGAQVRLGSQAPQDNTTWGLGRIDLPAGVAVPPGGQHTFQATLRAPSTVGTRAFQWKLLREGVQWFGAPTALVNVEVAP
ncbi:MAG: NBR1-Ig-like domain-containing protein [Myxococcota bacterium]